MIIMLSCSYKAKSSNTEYFLSLLKNEIEQTSDKYCEIINIKEVLKNVEGEALENFVSELKKLDKDIIKEVRGVGLMVGIELTKPGAEYVDKFREAGFLINCTAGNVLRFAPPLIVKEEEIDALVEALDKVFQSL